MLKYLYVPEKENSIDYIEYAKENSCIQIISGDSSILNEVEYDKDSVEIVKIPTILSITTEKNVYESGEDIKVIFVDEWLRDEKYVKVILKILQIDINDPNKVEEYDEIVMSYDGEYAFYSKFSIDQYGEYILQVYSEYDDGKINKKISKELIVYKKEEESKNDERLFDFKL